jgi:hypothetical protein
LAENMENKKSTGAGITGFVKGLWGWGGKKWNIYQGNEN